MDKNTKLYFDSARALFLSPATIDDIAGFSIARGKQRYFFRGAITPFNSSSGLIISSNKYCMNKLLASAGFPVAKANSYNIEEFQEECLESLIKEFNFPLVVKPTCGTALGEDVLCNITSMEQLRAGILKRFQRHKFLSIEEYHSDLNSYRVLILYNKVIGVVQRFPASVTGDGVHSIKELIDLQNIERAMRYGNLTQQAIKIDEECIHRLKSLKMTINTIPQLNEKIVICYTCNSSRGGTLKSLGKQIHKKNAQLLCRAAKELDLNFVGLDVACEDIMTPIETSRGIIIEANHAPDITLHEYPMEGKRCQVSKTIMRRIIFQHPILYLLGLLQSRRLAFYNRVLLVGALCLAGNRLIP